MFGNAKRLSEMTRKNDALVAELQQAKAERNHMATELEKALHARNAMESRLNELTAKVREQTDADLLKVSLKIILDTIRQGNALPGDLALQQALRSQQRSLSNTFINNSYSVGLGGLASMLGPRVPGIG